MKKHQIQSSGTPGPAQADYKLLPYTRGVQCPCLLERIAGPFKFLFPAMFVVPAVPNYTAIYPEQKLFAMRNAHNFFPNEPVQENFSPIMASDPNYPRRYYVVPTPRIHLDGVNG